MDNAKTQPQMQTVEQFELEAVSGGFYVDVTGMPDRSEMCGTMWYLDQLIKKFTPARLY
jgi:hypothetical protein